MKIPVSSTGQHLDVPVDPGFGRCAYFAILDTESGVLEATTNPFREAAGGAGTQAVASVEVAAPVEDRAATVGANQRGL